MIRLLFATRFSMFDLLFFAFLSPLVANFGPWWILLLVPASMFSDWSERRA